MYVTFYTVTVVTRSGWHYNS